tara:strand:+ start:82 stop:432 length:351 start_codon:yes stop_codon:yes gene_type:complete
MKRLLVLRNLTQNSKYTYKIGASVNMRRGGFPALTHVPLRPFNVGSNLAGAMASQNVTNQRKINTKTLCDLIGSRYYPNNEEIDMDEEKVVRCFDENDLLLGEMTLREAQAAADTV